MRVLCLHDITPCDDNDNDKHDRQEDNNEEPPLHPKLEKLQNRLRTKHDIDVVNVYGPILVEEGDTHPQKCWFHPVPTPASVAPPDPSLEPPNDMPAPSGDTHVNGDVDYIGLDASIYHLSQIWNRQRYSNPFIGILAFGQGATVAGLLPLLMASKQHRAHERTERISELEERGGVVSFAGLRFVCCVGGMVLDPPPAPVGCFGIPREWHGNHGGDEKGGSEGGVVVGVDTLHIIPRVANANVNAPPTPAVAHHDGDTSDLVSQSPSNNKTSDLVGPQQPKPPEQPHDSTIVQAHETTTLENSRRLARRFEMARVYEYATNAPALPSSKRSSPQEPSPSPKNSQQQQQQLQSHPTNELNEIGTYLVSRKQALIFDHYGSKETADYVAETQRHLSQVEFTATQMITQSLRDNPPKSLMAVILPNDLQRADRGQMNNNRGLTVGAWSSSQGMKHRDLDEMGGGAPCPAEFAMKKEERNVT